MLSPIIKTQRLVLRELNAEDAPALLQYRSQPDVYRYQSWKPQSLAEASEFIRMATRGFAVPGTWFQLGIYEANDQRLLGDCGIHFLEADGLQVEIGFTVASLYQRKGYGKEAVRNLIGYLFQELKVHRIVASVDPRNTASISLLESIGMRREGYFKKSLWNAGAWEDDVIYAVLAEEWMPEAGSLAQVELKQAAASAPELRALIAKLDDDLNGRYPEGGITTLDLDDPQMCEVTFVVAYWKGVAVGCGALRPLDREAIELKRFYVEPDFRQRGIAARILSYLEQQARHRGYRIIRLETGTRQQEAVCFYQKYSFREIGPYGHGVADELSLYYEKQIG